MFGDTGSRQGGSGCQSDMLSENIWFTWSKPLIIEYWVIKGRYWLVLGGTGSEQGGTGCQHDELSENIWFAGTRSSNY